jgi:aspartyl/asparaginyl beta-hydroxylase
VRNFIQIGSTDVLRLALQIDAHPEIWDRHDGRTGRAESPHNGVSDAWLRWRPLEALKGPENYNEPFAELQWYPAIDVLPAARFILMEIMARIGGTALGGALITKIPPGGAVKPHSDGMAWHARYFGRKIYTVIRSNPNAVNWCAGESLVMAPGTIWSFDNTLEHAVYNEGDEDRITMMCAIRES